MSRPRSAPTQPPSPLPSRLCRSQAPVMPSLTDHLLLQTRLRSAEDQLHRLQRYIGRKADEPLELDRLSVRHPATQPYPAPLLPPTLAYPAAQSENERLRKSCTLLQARVAAMEQILALQEQALAAHPADPPAELLARWRMQVLKQLIQQRSLETHIATLQQQTAKTVGAPLAPLPLSFAFAPGRDDFDVHAVSSCRLLNMPARCNDSNWSYSSASTVWPSAMLAPCSRTARTRCGAGSPRPTPRSRSLTPTPLFSFPTRARQRLQEELDMATARIAFLTQVCDRATADAATTKDLVARWVAALFVLSI